MNEIIIYTDRIAARANTYKSVKFAVIALIFLVVLNYLTSLIHITLVPMIAGGVILIAIINIIRNIILLRLPFIIINHERIKYFNALGYIRKTWDKIGRIQYFPKDKSIHFVNNDGSLISKIDLEMLNDQDISMIVDELRNKKELITINENKNQPSNQLNNI